MPVYPLLAPIVLAITAMIGMMITFMHEGDAIPAIIPVTGILVVLVLVNAIGVEWRARRQRWPGRLPGWALPFAGTIGGLATCAQLAIYLANDLQDVPVPWFVHVPGVAALIAVVAALHVAWRD